MSRAQMEQFKAQSDFPVLLLRRQVLFPGTVHRVLVGRKRSLALLKYLQKNGKVGGSQPSFVAVTLKDHGKASSSTDAREDEEAYEVGVVARIARATRHSQSRSTFLVVVQGVARVKVGPIRSAGQDFYVADVDPFPRTTSIASDDTEGKAHLKALRKIAADMIESLDPTVAAMSNNKLNLKSMSASLLADLLAAHSGVDIATSQSILETSEMSKRLKMVVEAVAQARDVQRISNEIESTVKSEISKTQRDYLLRQQLKAIHKELGDDDDDDEDGEGGGSAESQIERLKKRISEKRDAMPPEAREAATRDLRRLKTVPSSSAEHGVIVNWLEWMADLPWGVETTDTIDVEAAKTMLDEDHYGLAKVKERIVEYLAVRKLRGDMRGPILCLAGPPGVGKTSLGRSVARSMGRSFQRLSLGGVHDEAEIRGHRRTYIGAMPGSVVNGLKKAQSQNPVLLLDEIDKLGRDQRGDPSSALLEVLDPEQNCTFTDHYLNVPFDLSKVLFIATANELGMIPGPLRDRMEVIELPGYTVEEKVAIAQRHLIPKQLIEHGLALPPPDALAVEADVEAEEAEEAAAAAAEDAPFVESTPVSPSFMLPEAVVFADSVIALLATKYTREAGVRSLERCIAAVCRSVALDVARCKPGESVGVVTVDQERVEAVLGPAKFDDESTFRVEVPGVAIGLAWTQFGGDLLFIEATKYAGTGQLVVTGSVGDVMLESAKIAVGWLRAHVLQLKLCETLDDDPLRSLDLHLHFPAGAIPKDGPSAGVTIITALVSLLKGLTVRNDLAMTGEITLRGVVLPVGGIKEKVLAAHRLGMTKICVPERCRKDVFHDVPADVRADIEFVYAKRIVDVLRAAFDPSTEEGHDLDISTVGQFALDDGALPERARI